MKCEKYHLRTCQILLEVHILAISQVIVSSFPFISLYLFLHIIYAPFWSTYIWAIYIYVCVCGCVCVFTVQLF
jgi:hypothetical protein